MCRGEGVGRGMAVPATMTEQTKTLISTNKAHGKLSGVNLVFHQWCDYRKYQQGWHFQNTLFIRAVYNNIIVLWTIMHQQRISELYAIYI